MTFKINTSVSNAYLDNFYEQTTTADAKNTSAVVVQANNQTKPGKQPPIEKTISFTALGCDTEAKLAYAGYMAAAARNGIADREAQMQFAEAMMRQNGQLQSESLGQLDDGKVRSNLLNREVSFTINDDEKAALAQFRADYAAAGGQIRFNKNPTIDVRQAKTTDGVAPLPIDTPKNLKVSVLLNNDGSPITSERILAQYSENTYKNNSLWGDNFRRIGELSADQGIKPKITNITDVGNKKLVEFELSPRDRSVVHENYKLVQTEVNRARAAYEDFANNNEVSSFLRGVFNGAIGAVKNTVGLLNLPETMKALWQIVSSPKETFNALMTELGETWEEFKNAPPNKKSEMVGELVGAAVVEILLGKGIGKAGGILAKTKTGAKLLEKADALKAATAVKIAEAFSDEAAKVAKQRFSQKMATQLYSGIPIDAMADLAIIATNKVSKGVTRFADFSRQMIQELGENIRPRLEKLYREAMQKIGREVDDVEIKGTDVSQIARRQPITAANVGSVIVPGVRGGEFASWFNGLTKAEMDVLWTSKALRKTIEDRLRHPGGFHEWLPVSRAPKFREWGVKAEQIWDLRSKTSDVRFKNPAGVHGGLGSGTAHRELFRIIDESSNFEDFKSRLRLWAEQRLENGIDSLPEGLR